MRVEVWKVVRLLGVALLTAQNNVVILVASTLTARKKVITSRMRVRNLLQAVLTLTIIDVIQLTEVNRSAATLTTALVIAEVTWDHDDCRNCPVSINTA